MSYNYSDLGLTRQKAQEIIEYYRDNLKYENVLDAARLIKPSIAPLLARSIYYGDSYETLCKVEARNDREMIYEKNTFYVYRRRLIQKLKERLEDDIEEIYYVFVLDSSFTDLERAKRRKKILQDYDKKHVLIKKRKRNDLDYKE